MGIPRFKLFRLWKSFTLWRNSVRQIKTIRCRKYLQENLPVLNPVSVVAHLLYSLLNRVKQKHIPSPALKSVLKFNIAGDKK